MAPAVQQSFEQALTHHKAGRLTEAESLYRHVIAHEPAHADAHQMLGMLTSQSGRAAEAVELLRRSTSLNPRSPGAFNNLGLVLTNLGRIDEAINSFQRAVELQASFPEALNNLATAFRAGGQLDQAISAYRRALELRPNYPEALNNLGSAYREVDRLSESVASHRQAISMRPNYPQAWENLGHALRAQRKFDEAITAFRQAITLQPSSPGTLTTLGNTLKEVGFLDEAIKAYRQSLALRPDIRTSEDLLYTLHFQDDDPKALFDEHARWNETYALPLKRSIALHLNDRSPERRLRVGYVSPDFRSHVLALIGLPLLEHHDHDAFEIFCYSNVSRPDPLTPRFQRCADHWREISRLSDEQAVQLIRDDGIDLLVDLTLHMDRSRPLIFARKPVPVQLTWFAYPGTSGLTAIDYRLTDSQLDPHAADDRFYSEKTVRLPETFWCYHPQAAGIDVNEPPVLRSGSITFGCLNNFCKITPRTLNVWAKVMTAMPGSRLLLLAPPSSAREVVLQALARENVASSRIGFFDYLPRDDYLRLYHGIDLCLDTIPYPGHTTTLDALWMGVPVVTLPGRSAASRGGASILTNAGLVDLIAHDPEGYVRIVLDLATDVPRLRKVRAELRPRLQKSPLMDAPCFARNFEEALRKMWRAWCNEHSHP